MSATPAIIAGVKVVLCTPSLNGRLNGSVYYAAKKLGIKEYYSLGGASGDHGISNGNKKIKAVNKIVGAGSKWVALAKKKMFFLRDYVG